MWIDFWWAPSGRHSNKFQERNISTTSVPQAQRTPLYSVQFVLSDRHLIILVRCNIFSSRVNCLQTLFFVQVRIIIGVQRILVVLGRVSGAFGSCTYFRSSVCMWVCPRFRPRVCAFTHRRTGGAIWCTRARTNGAMLQLQPLLLQRLALALVPWRIKDK